MVLKFNIGNRYVYSKILPLDLYNLDIGTYLLNIIKLQSIIYPTFNKKNNNIIRI